MRRSLAARDAALTLAVDALAVHRLTQLVTSDTITARPRARLIARAYRRDARRQHESVSDRIGQSVHPMSTDDWHDLVVLEGSDAPKLAVLVTCRACAGVWVAGAVVAARRLLPGWPTVARALAVAAAAQMIVHATD